MKKLLFLTFLILSLSLQASNPDSTKIFIEIQDIWNLDLNKETVNVDFNLNLDYAKPLNKHFYLLNGTILTIDTLANDNIGRFLSIRIIAEIRTNFNYDRFPIDNQMIEIIIEPYQYANELIYWSDQSQNIFIGKIHLNGWITDNIKVSNNVEIFKVRESQTLKEYPYSSAKFEIPIYRDHKIANFFKAYLPILISILIIYIGFLLHPDQIELRINLAVGSLFVMISNFIVAQKYLPNVSSFTLIEKLNIESLIIISITIFYFAFRYRQKVKTTTQQKSRTDASFIIIASVVYIAIFIILIC